MKNKLCKLTAVVLVICLLTGCGIFERLQPAPKLTFADLAYTRPDMQAIEQLRSEAVETAQEGKRLAAMVSLVQEFYAAYDAFYTNYYLASIYYDCDMTDESWQAEYEFCTNASLQVDTMLDEIYRAMAKSDLRQSLEAPAFFGEDFFVGYEGESPYDEGYMALAERENQLENSYYELYAQTSEGNYTQEEFYETYGQSFAQLYADLIAVRQEMAAYFGYESYAQLAYDMYYYREYSPEETAAYMQEIAAELGQMYRNTYDRAEWNWGAAASVEAAALGYVRKAAQAMGGNIQQAFTQMEEGKFYHISPGSNKYDGAYEVFFSAYGQPFIFAQTYRANVDKLTVVHEFGHYVHDYVCQGTYASLDVREVMSQTMEYLSTLYGEDGAAERYKLLDGLSVLVENACYTLFELRAYELKGEELNPERLAELYEQTCLEFGLTWDVPLGFTDIEHYFAYPMYVSSYVYSADVAFQIYQQEKAQTGAGLETYNRCLTSHDTYLVEFALTYGLDSPLAPGRAATIRQSLEAVLSE